MDSKVIFFDIDGTLLSTGGAGQVAMERALVDGFSIGEPFEGVLTAGRTDRGISDEIFQRYQIDNTQANRERFRDAYLSHLQVCLSETSGLLPCVTELLQQLAAIDHVVLSLLTGNYADGAWIKLRHHRIQKYFEFGGFGDHHADRDDVARNAMKVAEQSLESKLCGMDMLVIGDTPADIRCAKAIGARCVAVATGVYTTDDLEPHAPDHLCHDFRDTSPIVARILELLS